MLGKVNFHGGRVITRGVAQRTEQTVEILLLTVSCVLGWVVFRCPGVIVHIAAASLGGLLAPRLAWAEQKRH